MSNDRFKCRVWSNIDRKYLEEEFTLSELIYSSFPYILRMLGYDLTDCIIEQCTGIKDKNGKLIFEGDKVRTVTGAVGVVVWHTELAGFAIEFDGKSYCQIYQTQEIIGNIHEDNERK